MIDRLDAFALMFEYRKIVHREYSIMVKKLYKIYSAFLLPSVSPYE